MTPSEAQGQDITFLWRTADGSATAERAWDLALPSENGEKDQAITADEMRSILETLPKDSESSEWEQTVLSDGAEITYREMAEILEADSWSLTIPAGSADPVTFSVQAGSLKERTKGTGTFLIQIFDVRNALVSDADGETSNRLLQQLCDGHLRQP